MVRGLARDLKASRESISEARLCNKLISGLLKEYEVLKSAFNVISTARTEETVIDSILAEEARILASNKDRARSRLRRDVVRVPVRVV